MKYKALKDFRNLRTGESFEKGKTYELEGYQAEAYKDMGFLEEVKQENTSKKAAKAAE